MTQRINSLSDRILYRISRVERVHIVMGLFAAMGLLIVFTTGKYTIAEGSYYQ